MKVLFLLERRPQYAGTSVYADELMKELGSRLKSCGLFILSEANDWKKALLETIRTTQPDLVHVLYANPGKTLLIGLLLRKLPILKVLTVHQIPPKESRIGGLYKWPRAYFFARGLRYFYSRFLLLRALRYFSVLLAPNQTTKTDLEKLSGRSVRRIPEGMRLRNGSPNGNSGGSILEFLRGEKKKPLIFTVGGFIFHKGIHQMLDALARIVPDYPDVQYVVAGTKRDPAYFRYLQAKVLAKGLKGHVWLLPDADAETVAALHKNCDVYIQPSYEEGFCLTFLQALAMRQGQGKHAVLAGGATGEIPALMELGGMRDFVFDAKNVSSIEEKLRLALHAAGNGFSPHIEWQKIVETYSWEKIAMETYQAYELARARS